MNKSTELATVEERDAALTEYLKTRTLPAWWWERLKPTLPDGWIVEDQPVADVEQAVS